MKRNPTSKRPTGVLPITDEDLCVAYAQSITKTVIAESGMEGMQHTMFLVLHAGSHRNYVRLSVPFAWAPTDSLEDVERVLAESFSACVQSGFAHSDHPVYQTIASFGLAFKRRLLDDQYDDKRIRNIILLIGHPEGFGTIVSLRGPREWEISKVAKELGVSLRKKEEQQYANG